MADKGQKEVEEGPSTPALPHAWSSLGLGFAILACVGAFAAVVLMQYLKARPVDLLTVTEEVAYEVESVLANHLIPEANIRRSKLAPQQDDKARWYKFSHEVRLTPLVSLEGIAKVLTDKLRERYVQVEKIPQGPGTLRLTLYLESLAFATVELSESVGASFGQKPGAAASVVPPQAVPVSAPEQEPVRTPPPPEAGSGEKVEIPAEGSTAKATPPTPREDARPRLAIIVDDGGYGGSRTERILGLSPQLTLAMFPNTPHSVETAQRAAQLGFEVMLHVPMESKRNNAIFPGGELSTGMSADEIRQMTKEFLMRVPGVKGVNNHEGSKFTTDREALRPFLEEVKSAGLFFIDSRSDPATKGYMIAQELGIASAESDVFLDNKKERSYILERFDKLARQCRSRGQAIGICHFDVVTIAVLAEILIEIDKQGLQLVHASELVE